jgi:hypothetical protein
MATMKTSGESLVPPALSVPRVPDAGELQDWAAVLVDRARAEGELTGEDGLLTALVRQVLQTGLEVETTDHLGYERHDPSGRGSGNGRNGHYPKTVKTEIGEVDLRRRGTARAASSRPRCARASAAWTASRGT